MTSPEVTIIVPLFNEEDNIIPFYNKLNFDLVKKNYGYELIFVDDGSTDSSLQILEEIKEKDNRIKIIHLRRNFGKSIALQIGFLHAVGNIAITMDGDLQDDSAEIPKFIEKLNEGLDLVSGWKYPRFDPLTKTLPSKFFNYFTKKMTGVNIHDFNCGFKAYKKEVYKSISLYGEMHRFTPVLAARLGYKISEIQVKHHPRLSGKSKFGFSRLFKGTFDLITVLFLSKYANRPLHAFGIPGLISVLAGTTMGFYLVSIHFFLNEQIGERPLLLLSILLIVLGFQFFSLGLIGEMFVYQTVEKTSLDQNIAYIVE